MIYIHVQSDGFKSEFAKLIAQTQNPKDLLMVAGGTLQEQLRNWFAQKDQTDVNKLNPSRREHFWLQIMRSVQLPVMEGNVTVSVTIMDPRLAQRYFGGWISAKNAKALTVPETAEAYGRTAKTFEEETGLKLILIKIGGTKTSNFENAILAAKENGAKGLTVEYLLTPAVWQEGDESALPPMSQLEAAILQRSQEFLDSQPQP